MSKHNNGELNNTTPCHATTWVCNPAFWTGQHDQPQVQTIDADYANTSSNTFGFTGSHIGLDIPTEISDFDAFLEGTLNSSFAVGQYDHVWPSMSCPPTQNALGGIPYMEPGDNSQPGDYTIAQSNSYSAEPFKSKSVDTTTEVPSSEHKASRRRHRCTQPGCDQTFGRPQEFRRHLIVKHNSQDAEKTPRCMFCRYSYPRLDKVRNHMEKVHGCRVQKIDNAFRSG